MSDRSKILPLLSSHLGAAWLPSEAKVELLRPFPVVGAEGRRYREEEK